jgi:hypothetical protein
MESSYIENVCGILKKMAPFKQQLPEPSSIHTELFSVISVTIKGQHSELESAVELGTQSRCRNRNDKSERMLVDWNGGGTHLD